MGPLRIIILVVLLYIGYRLIAANFRKESSSDNEKKSSGKTGGAITDILVEDPVCHKLVPKEQAVKAEIDDKTYFFCSRECCDKFTADQEGTH